MYELNVNGRFLQKIFMFCVCSVLMYSVGAQNSSELTEFGAVRAANADGSIPAYAGGLTRPPSGFNASSGIYVDPFSDESPLYAITSANLDEYREQLTDGTIALFEKWPEYRINVYRTHRTMHYPEWVLENSSRNSGNARLGGNVVGDSVENAFPGIPFPRPENGYQVMWNSFLRFYHYASITGSAWLVDSRGRPIELLTGSNHSYSPFYESRTGVFDGYYLLNTISMTGPANLAGYVQLQQHPIDYGKGQSNWVYDPGQRRVRVAPNYAYDTPAAQFGGALFYDEGLGFFGRLDRFDFKLVGRKEVIVPYNNYKFFTTPARELLGPKFLNPEHVRWEKHRMWVVEATRKSGARHAYSKRILYIDEDSWAVYAMEGYDNNGNIHRVGYGYPLIDYSGRGGVLVSTVGYYDLVRGSYMLSHSSTASGPARFFFSERVPNMNMFSPQGIAGASNR